jgi:hypothetical protein
MREAIVIEGFKIEQRRELKDSKKAFVGYRKSWRLTRDALELYGFGNCRHNHPKTANVYIQLIA